MRQEGILLGLVKSMDLVDKDHRGVPLSPVELRLSDGLANFLHTTEHRRDHELARPNGTHQESGECSLANAWWPPENHGGQTTTSDRLGQRGARTEKMILSQHLVELLRAHQLSQGHRRGHCEMTSVPAGITSWNWLAGIAWLMRTCEKRMRRTRARPSTESNAATWPLGSRPMSM